MCDLFSALSLQEVQKVKSGNWMFLENDGKPLWLLKVSQTSKRGGNNALVGDLGCVRGSPPSFNFCWFLNQKSRGSLTKWTRQVISLLPSPVRQITRTTQRLESYTMSDRERLKLINELCKTCSRHRVIPTSMHVPDCSRDAAEVEYTGGFANVSQSTYEGHRVAVKVVHVYSNNLKLVLSVSDLPFASSHYLCMNAPQGFCREVVAWKHLRHPNILPLLGVTVSENRFAMVSEWMDNGNINEFVRKDHDANRTALVRANIRPHWVAD